MKGLRIFTYNLAVALLVMPIGVLAMTLEFLGDVADQLSKAFHAVADGLIAVFRDAFQPEGDEAHEAPPEPPPTPPSTA